MNTLKHIWYTKPEFDIDTVITSGGLKFKVTNISKKPFCDIDEQEFIDSGHGSKRQFMTWYRMVSEDIQANPDLWIIDSEVVK